jgi:hypothetical protein
MFLSVFDIVGRSRHAHRRAGVALLVVSLASIGCANDRTAPSRSRMAVDLRTEPVALNRDDSSQHRVGRFAYAGGLELTAASTVHLGGLSDLVVLDDGRFLSVADDGRLFEGRLLLDADRRLSGVADATLTPLTSSDGRQLRDKSEADAEGLTVLPGGDRLVSFERLHRIARYPAGGGPASMVAAPSVAWTLPSNAGLEALAAFPQSGPAAYLVGSEQGAVWRCDLNTGCRETALGSYVPKGFSLTSLAVSPDGATVGLLARAFDEVRGVRVIVRLLTPAAVDRPGTSPLDELSIAAPITRDNFEGLALTEAPGKAGNRLYLLSDNNFSDAQHTYLMAFDWMPQ